MDKILEVKKLKIAFRTSSGTLKAVRDISFDLERGKTLAIVGESGSGKSVTSKAIIGILAGNSITEGGEILYDGKDLLRIPEDEMHRIRGDKISMIFQDPLSSLNPIVKIGKQITEAMLLKNKANRREARKDSERMLALIREKMIAATGNQAAVNAEINTFRNTCKAGTKLELTYNQAMTSAQDLLSDTEDALFNISKKQKTDLSGVLTNAAKRLAKVNNAFLLAGNEDEYHQLPGKLTAAAASAKGCAVTDENAAKAVTASLEELKAFLQGVTSSTRPNFFAIGYCGMNAPQGSDIAKLNETCQAKLDKEFMNGFRKDVAAGVEYSVNSVRPVREQVVAEMTAAHDFFNGSFTAKEGDAKAAELTKLVEKSIDRTEIIKDSAAYAFGASISNAVKSFFTTQEYNKREEKRFSTQNARREALIAKGRHVDWKVVPKNVYAVEDLRANILTVIDRVQERTGLALEKTVDYQARAAEIVEYLQKKESDSIYRITKSMAKEKAIKLMEEVGIHEPRTRFYQYPFEFSGGMRQRIVIAIALAADPDILICDEPTTALDVTIQAQILELINRLKKERNLSVIFITHDLGVVANMADDIAVMYAGKIIEYGTADDIFYRPCHPYTWALLSSMPDLDTTEKLDAIPGTPPNMIYPPVGDAFADRNKYAMQIDFEQQPPMFRVSDTHSAATWLLHPDAPKVEMPKIIRDRIARNLKNEGGEA